MEPSLSADEVKMWQSNARQSEFMEAGNYPERPGEPDCSYYIRTGLCKFGMICRFNHPPNRNLVSAARAKVVYPERLGQPECQYYMRTGTCKFGATCIFNHPREKIGISERFQLNILGYPLRPNEKACAYYLRTGQCKFGNICKFHHPQPDTAMISLRGSTSYPFERSPTGPDRQYFSGTSKNFSVPRTTSIPSPRWQGNSSYAPVIIPQELTQVSGWNAYPGQLWSSSPSEGHQHSPETSTQYYGASQQNTSVGPQGGFTTYRPGPVHVAPYTIPRESEFPQRPNQPECQFYLKTGDCKFGAVCRFHHPKERRFPAPDCLLSPLGLPLRPGGPLCAFYSRYGICKFGPNCKFDHPMAAPAYSPSSSPVSVAAPAVWRLVSSSSGPPSVETTPRDSSSSMVRPAKPRRPSLSDGDVQVAEGSRPSGPTTSS